MSKNKQDKQFKKFTPKRKSRVNFIDDKGNDLEIEDNPQNQSHHRRKKNQKRIRDVKDEDLNIENLKEGLIIEVSRKNCKVLINDNIHTCVIGGMFINREESLIATGDNALVEMVGSNEWVIRKILPRKTKLSRPAAIGTKLSNVREKIIASNIDVIAIVVAAAKPSFKPALIDRYLLTAQKNNVGVIIIMNKMDLVSEKPESIQDFIKLGIPTIFTTATENKGIEEIKECLKGKTAVFTGHSGVGKSSILNSLSPDLALDTSDVGDGKHCWRHTTRKSTLYKVPNSGTIIDTPGIRELGVWDIPPETLSWYFPDFHEAAENCKFSNCLHYHEPKCAVIDGVETGEISSFRYESYLRVYDSLLEIKKNKSY